MNEVFLATKPLCQSPALQGLKFRGGGAYRKSERVYPFTCVIQPKDWLHRSRGINTLQGSSGHFAGPCL